MMTSPEYRCGFCSLPVSGRTVDIALPSEAHAAHPASIVNPSTIPGEPAYNPDGDTDVYRCDDGTGCNT